MMEKSNYGVDAPKVILNLLVIEVAFFNSLFLPENAFPPLSAILKSSAFFPAICLIIAGLLMIAYGKFGNLKQRDRIIGLHQWKGDEMVLDVGTGLGLLLAGVATKLTAGKACGIDVFNRYDLSGNTLSGLQENLRTENVTERTVIVKQSILETSFNDQTFDVVVSNLCLHNIYDAVSRKKACGEI
jgi:SAM-dependent methyltransferase